MFSIIFTLYQNLLLTKKKMHMAKKKKSFGESSDGGKENGQCEHCILLGTV